MGLEELVTEVPLLLTTPVEGIEGNGNTIQFQRMGRLAYGQWSSSAPSYLVRMEDVEQ